MNNTRTPVQILPMTAETASQVAELERICFHDPWSLDSLTKELSNPLAVYFTAILSDKVIGYVGMHHILDEGHITNVAVSPKFRRKGVARLLIGALIGYARANRLRMLTLEVRRSNAEAISLYGSFGFVQAGTRTRYYRGPDEDALIMTLEFA